MNMEWEKLSETSTKVSYKWVTDKTFRQPDGRKAVYTTWHKPSTQSVAVVAVTKGHKIIIAKQYRPGPEKFLYELPGGGIEPGEELAAAAARELLEETGYVSEEPLEYIGMSCSDAYTNNTNVYFIARNCTKQADQVLDDGEFVEVLELDFKDVLGHVKQGEMSDAVAILQTYDELSALVKV